MADTSMEAGRRVSEATVFRVLLLLCACPVSAAAQEPLGLPRIDGPITLDGVPDEAAWQRIDPLPLVMHTPTYGGTPTERTEVRVAYDDDYLYVAGHLYDSDPDGVRENSLYRDRWSGDDTFGFILDTFNDNENALWFYTNPAGVRFDQTVTGDANAESWGAYPFESSWNTYWDVAVTRNESGWFADSGCPTPA